jgi:hypothetical protein
MFLMTVLSIAGALATGGEGRVRPTAEPSAPQPSEAVVIRFKTTRTMDGVYHAEAEREGCGTRSSARRSAPPKGRDVRLRIRAPRAGWCAGAYRAIVYFKQTVSCPPTIACGDSYERRVGSTRFTVKP